MANEGDFAEVMKGDALAALSAPFKTEEVKQRTQGGKKLDYISIDSTIRRFNEVLGTDWSTHTSSVDVRQLADGKHLAIVVLSLEALGKSAVGTGADIAQDVDKALKTALAEALKKAGHQFGVGLYLWDEGERQVVARDRAALSGDVAALKAKVFEKALEGGATPTAEGVAQFFKVEIADLQDAAKLKTLLES